MKKSASKYNEMERLELYKELEHLRREQISLSMQAASGQLTKWHLIKDARRNIARIKTYLNKVSTQ